MPYPLFSTVKVGCMPQFLPRLPVHPQDGSTVTCGVTHETYRSLMSRIIYPRGYQFNI
jgi:hypothetical protein